MKTFTKVLALSLVLAMLMVSSASAYYVSEAAKNPVTPFSDKPLDIKVIVYPQEQIVFSEFDKNDYTMFKLFDKISGLNIDWEVRDPAAIKETLSTLMASGDLPDMIQGMSWSASEIADYGVSQGLLYPIDTLLEYMPIFTDILAVHPELKATLTAPDGHIYGLPQLIDSNSYRWPMWLNQNWLNAVGKEVPTTLAEFADVLRAFKAQDANGNGDANDEIPWTASWSEGYSVEGWLLNAFDLVGTGDTLVVDYSDGIDNMKLAYAPYASEYKDYLTYMHDLYTEGLIDPDMFTQNNAQTIAKVNDNTAGGWLGDGNIQNALSGVQDAFNVYTGISPLVKAEGDTPKCAGYDFYECFCTAAISADVTEEKAIALAKMLDYYYSVEFYDFVVWGPVLGSEMDPDNRGVYSITDENGKYVNRDYAGNDGSFTRWTYQLTFINPWHQPGFASGNNNYRSYIYENKLNPVNALSFEAKAETFIACKDYYQWEAKLVPYYTDGVPSLFMDEDDNDNAILLKAQLDTYARNAAAKFITGELDLEKDYDSYISNLEKYGVKEYEELQNKYFSTYAANR